jgi:hypothetical protein
LVLDAGVGVTGTTSVTAWADQSPNGNNFTAASGVEPELELNVINGRPVVKRGSINARLTGPNWPNADLLANGGITVYIVGSQSSAGGTLDSSGRFLNAGATSNAQLMRNGSNNEYSANLRGGLSLTGAIAEDTFYTFRMRNDLSNTYMAINNGTETSTAATGPSTVTSPTLLFANLSSGWGNKRIAAVYVFTENHDTAKQTIVENYLRNRFNHY